MKANYITKRAKYSDFLQEWNENQFNAVKIAARDFMKSAPAWDTFNGEGFRRRSFGMCNFYELENRLGLAYTSSGACAGLWLCNMSVYAPNDWHPTKAAGRYKIIAFVMAADCSIWAAVEEENETDIYFLQISAPELSAPGADPQEEYKNELAKVWAHDTRMIKYCYGQASQVVRLSGGELVPIEFCVLTLKIYIMSAIKRYLEDKAYRLRDYINSITSGELHAAAAENVAYFIAFGGDSTTNEERLFDLVTMHPEYCGHYLRHIAILDAITIAAAQCSYRAEISSKDAEKIYTAARDQKMKLYGTLSTIVTRYEVDEDDGIYKCY